MSVLGDVLDRLEREDELKAEVLEAMRAILRANETAPYETEARPGFGLARVRTPEFVAAVRRYARALTAQSEYLIDKAKHYETQ